MIYTVTLAGDPEEDSTCLPGPVIGSLSSASSFAWSLVDGDISCVYLYFLGKSVTFTQTNNHLHKDRTTQVIILNLAEDVCCDSDKINCHHIEWQCGKF